MNPLLGSLSNPSRHRGGGYVFTVSWLLLDGSPGVACVADSVGRTRHHHPPQFNMLLSLHCPTPILKQMPFKQQLHNE